jgi:hypothetical protein
MRRPFVVLAITTGVGVLFLPATVLADNCSSLSDCFQTVDSATGVIAGLVAGLGILFALNALSWGGIGAGGGAAPPAMNARTNPDGSKTTTLRQTSANGTITLTQTNHAPDGSLTGSSTEVASPDGIKTLTDYGPDGRITASQTTLPAGTSVREITSPDGTRTFTTYGPDGTTTTTLDPNGPMGPTGPNDPLFSTPPVINPDGSESTINDDGSVTTRQYDPTGTLTGISYTTDTETGSHTDVFDGQGTFTGSSDTTSDPNGDTVTKTYDANGNLTGGSETAVDDNGVETTKTYGSDAAAGLPPPPLPPLDPSVLSQPSDLPAGSGDEAPPVPQQTLTGIANPDGSLTFDDGQGNVTTPPPPPVPDPGVALNPDGTLTTLNPDGSTTTTMPLQPKQHMGMKTNPDGTVTTLNPDGSTTTTVTPNTTESSVATNDPAP